MRVLKIIGGVFAALIVGGVILLLTVDVGKYKGLLQDQATAATGREVSIGDIKLSLSLSPAIVIGELSIANAPGGSRPKMLTLKRLEAHTQLIPLLFGTVNVSGLKLVDLDVVLETDARGKGNWEFDTASAPSAAPLPLNVSGVSVDGLKLAYRDGKTKGASTIAAKSVDVEIAGPITDLIIPTVAVTDAAATFREGGSAGDAAIGEMRMTSVGAITDFNITKLAIKGAKGSYKDGPSTFEGAAATLDMNAEPASRSGAKSGDVDLVAALKALKVTSLSSENVTGSFKDAQKSANLASSKVTLEAKGSLGDLGITNLVLAESKLSYKSDRAPIDLDVSSLSLNSAGALAVSAKLGGQGVNVSGTLAPMATLAGMKKSFPAKLAFDGLGLKATTDLIIDPAKKRPSANGTVNIPELDLAAVLKATGVPQGTARASKSGERVFSDEALPWDSLASADGNVKLSVGKLTLSNGLVLTNVVLPVDLSSGKLTLAAAAFSVAGGTVTSDATMDANDKSFALRTTANGISAEALARELKKTDLITQGPLDLSINVRGAGNSPHAVMASLNGSIVGGMGESRIRSDALNVIGADVIMQVASAINPLGNKDPYTVARCGVVNLQIVNGVANTNNGIALVTDKMQVTSSGRIDFGSERVDLNLRPKATGGLGVGLGTLAQAVKVSGPLSNPGVGIDKVGAIKTLSALGAAFATGGASILAQSAKDRIDGGDPCQAARTWHLKK